MPASSRTADIDHLPAKDVFLAEVFVALEASPAAEVAQLVDLESQRREALLRLSPEWAAQGHLFDTAGAPETQQERAGHYGYCVRCGFLIHRRGQVTVKGTASCAPARIDLR